MRVRLTDELLDRARIAVDRPQAYLFDTELPCFGVVLGARVQTFVVNYRDRGVKKRRALGHRSASFGVEQAREAARAVLGTRNGSNYERLRQAEQRLLFAVRDYVAAMVHVQLGERALARRRRR